MKFHAQSARALVAVPAAIALLLPMAAAAAAPAEGGAGTTGSDYSDLVVLLRADDGTPLLKKYLVPAEDPADPATVEYCVQPVSYDPIPGVLPKISEVDGTEVYVIPLQGEWLDPEAPRPDPFPVAEIEPCDPQPAFGMFVSEVELERLNMARTADRVMDDKIAAVEAKLLAADIIDLDPAGRIRLDGVPIDAAPEHAGIYQSLMYTGTIPGLPTEPVDMAGPPALVGPAPAQPAYNSQFDAWELAAAAVGTAASKGVPITIDTIEYYNQVIGFPPADLPVWEDVTFLRSYDPDLTDGTKLTTGRRYVDYSGFTYSRAATYPGSVTWLDVLALEWRVSPILDAVDFTNPAADTGTLHGLEAFKQMADDTRAVILYLHDNEVILPGFFMDPVGINTIEAQRAAVRDPAVSLGALPSEVFQGMPFGVTASLFNPHASTPAEEGGSLITNARLRVTIDAAGALLPADVTAATTPGDVPLDFAADPDGNLVAWLGDGGFDVPPGYHVEIPFKFTITDGAQVGPYTMRLELVDLDTPETVRASDQGIVKVNDNVTTVVWGGEVPTLATQGSYLTVPLRVYAPDALPATLRLAVTGPPAPALPLAAGDVNVYASNGLTMVEMPLALDTGKLVGTWDLTTVANDYKDVIWYVRFREGAPEGGYALDINLVGGNALETALVAVVAPEAHGEQTDKTPPDVHVETVGTLSADATFLLTTAVAEDGTTYSGRLAKDDVVVSDWKNITDGDHGSVTYTGLAPGNYVFSGRAFDAAGNGSDIVTRAWVVRAGSTPPPAGDVTPPVLQVGTVGSLGSSASFTLSTSPAGDAASYACQLTTDGVAGPWEPCASGSVTYSDLELGDYVFSATATDAAGNVSSLVSVAWHVYDTEAPVVLVAVDGTLGTSASFTLTTAVAEEGVTYECRLTKDDAPSVWENCTSGSIGVRSYTDLEPGTYVFSGRAIDTAGNDSEAVTRSWTVMQGEEPPETVTPETEVVAGPANHAWVLAKTARFTLGSDTDGAQFQVRVNGKDAADCASEACVVNVQPGPNRVSFAARVGDSVDPTPAVRTVFVPRSSYSLEHSAGWRLREGSGHLFGKYAETRQQGEVLRHWFGNVRRVALVASTGPGQGRVHVYLGKVRLTAKAINLGGYTQQTMRLIQVKTMAEARSGVLRVVVVSDGARVRVDGVGIAHR